MAPTLKDWLLAPIGKSDELADYLAQRPVSFHRRPPPDFTDEDFKDSGNSCAKPSRIGRSN